jgi:hypothetical protein
MINPNDGAEKRQRRLEYSAILDTLNHSEMMHRTKPHDAKGLPALIMEWQCEMRLVYNYAKGEKQKGQLLKPPKNAVEFRSEYARSLALFIVSQDANMSQEHLVKLCRGYDPPLRAALPNRSTEEGLEQ